MTARIFHGVGVSPGIARGTIFVYRPDDEAPPMRRIEESEIPAEIARFETALIATRGQILEMQQRIAESIGAKDAGIFDAHLLVVEDRTLIDEVLRRLGRRSRPGSPRRSGALESSRRSIRYFAPERRPEGLRAAAVRHAGRRAAEAPIEGRRGGAHVLGLRNRRAGPRRGRGDRRDLGSHQPRRSARLRRPRGGRIGDFSRRKFARGDRHRRRRSRRRQ